MISVRLGLVAGFVVATALAACGSDDGTTVETTTVAVTPDAQWVDDPAPAPEEDGGVTPGKDAAAASCPPATVPDFSNSWMPRKPPRNATGSCASGQLTTILSACEFGEAPCQIDSAHLPCFDCLYSLDTDATYSFRAYVPDARGERLNFRGYAMRTGASEACGNAIEDYAGCYALACSCIRSGSRLTCYEKVKTGACKAADDAMGAACQGHASVALLRPIIETGDFGGKANAITIAKAFCGGS